MTEKDNRLFKAIQLKVPDSFGFFMTTSPIEKAIEELTEMQIDIISSLMASSLREVQAKIIYEMQKKEESEEKKDD